MKLADLKTLLDKQLALVTVSSAQATAERNLLLEHFLHVPVEALFAEPDKEIAEANGFFSLMEALKHRVEKRIPIQYLLEESVFYGLRFHVSPAVLIPRPETELLVEQALSLCRQHHLQTVLDLGTGSGCIAISLNHALPQLQVTAVDCSTEALAISNQNAERHHTPVRFLHGSWFAPVADETFDLIVSNPPYISQHLRSTLTPEVLNEPENALFPSEGDPITLYRQLIAESQQYLTPQGHFLFELGEHQAGELVFLAENFGFTVNVYRDYSGIERILHGCR